MVMALNTLITIITACYSTSLITDFYFIVQRLKQSLVSLRQDRKPLEEQVNSLAPTQGEYDERKFCYRTKIVFRCVAMVTV